VTMLEEALRRTFADAVDAVAPLRPDPAGQAISRACAIRRRQRMVASTAVMLAIVVLASGTWWAHRAGAEPAHSFADMVGPARRDVDFSAGNVIYESATGTVQTLQTTGGVAPAPVRIPAGYLYRSAKAAVSITGQFGRPFVEEPADTYAVSPEGLRLAWIVTANGTTTASVAAITSAGLGNRQTSEVPRGSRVVGFTGRYVVLGDGGKAERYDMWDPAAPFVATWTDAITSVAGLTDDGVIGVVVDSRGVSCLVRLDAYPTGPRETGRRCGLTTGTGPVQVYVSLGAGAVIQGNTVLVVDPSTLFGAGPPPGRCVADGAVRPVISFGAGLVTLTSGDTTWACDIATGEVQILANPGHSAGGPQWLPVPAYGFG
jgi:hypothetical protein